MMSEELRQWCVNQTLEHSDLDTDTAEDVCAFAQVLYDYIREGKKDG